MRLPIPRLRSRCCSGIAWGLLALGLTINIPPASHAQDQPPLYTSREQAHQSLEWQLISPHLPDPRTASPQELELEGDILRARHFPLDALDFYHDALGRGGNVPALLNKLGLTELEMHNYLFARSYFQRALKMDRANSGIWNNLGAVEFIDGQVSRSISDYKHAIKLKQHESIYHANLATAYFADKNFNSARHEMIEALELDPDVFERGSGIGGVAAHVLSTEERARLAFELARIYARQGLEEPMVRALTEATQAGMDIQPEMRHDPLLMKYLNDPQIVTLLHNGQLLRAGKSVPMSGDHAPPTLHPL